MMGPLQGRIALITGGSRGIGRATALKLASWGADVAINYLRHRAAAAAAVEAVAACGVRVHAVRGNVGDPDDVRRMVASTVEALGGVDIVVSNAALGVLRPALELKPKHWQRTLDVMGRAFLLLAQAAVPHMEQRGGGDLIAISSLGSTHVIPYYAAAGVAKGILETLTRYLAVELAPRNVRVNAVSGGVVETEALRHFPNREEMLSDGRARSPLQRPGQPEDIANVVALLCLPEAAWIRGQVVIADGGYSLPA